MGDTKALVPAELIERKIFLIRGHKVLVDSDLAELYGVETKQLKRAVKRNTDEYTALRCQTGTLNRGAHSKYLPMAFTEQGVAMLSSVLNSQRAIQVNIAIMRAFVKLRQMLLDNKDMRRELEEMKRTTDDRFQIVFETLDQLLSVEEHPKHKIGFIAKEHRAGYAAKKKVR